MRTHSIIKHCTRNEKKTQENVLLICAASSGVYQLRLHSNVELALTDWKGPAGGLAASHYLSSWHNPTLNSVTEYVIRLKIMPKIMNSLTELDKHSLMMVCVEHTSNWKSLVRIRNSLSRKSKSLQEFKLERLCVSDAALGWKNYRTAHCIAPRAALAQCLGGWAPQSVPHPGYSSAAL